VRDIRSGRDGQNGLPLPSGDIFTANKQSINNSSLDIEQRALLLERYALLNTVHHNRNVAMIGPSRYIEGL
jgi:hypothetical protein